MRKAGEKSPLNSSQKVIDGKIMGLVLIRGKK